MTDWIEHDVKSRPDLPVGTLVQVRFSDGYESDYPATTDEWEWEHFAIIEDITHYRVVAK